MKMLKYLLGTFIVLIAFSSCEKNFLEVNEDPNESVNVEPGLLFMDVVTGHATNYMDIAPAMQYWSQQMGAGSNNAGVFSNPELYKDLDGYGNSNTWSAYWSAMKSLRLARGLAEKFENQNGIAQCDLFESLIFLHATLMWEDIPFSQALNFDVYPQPDFDTQENVLKGILAKIDAALALIKVDNTFSIKEIMYEGDMAKWQRFGNSLKLKVLMFLASRDPQDVYTTAIDDLVKNPSLLMQSSADDLKFPYFDKSGNKNPFFKLLETFNSSKPGYLYPGKVMVDLMNKRVDPRRAKWFVDEDGNTPATFEGVSPGSPLTDGMCLLNPATIVAPDASIYFGTYAEQELYIAEAIINGWAKTGNSQDHFTNAIRSNMAQWGVATADIDAYISQRPILSGIDKQDALKEIWSEHYVVDLLRPQEGFANQKRAGYPAIILPVGAVLDNFVTRWPIPNSEVSSNPKAGKYKKALTEKMWIDKQ